MNTKQLRDKLNIHPDLRIGQAIHLMANSNGLSYDFSFNGMRDGKFVEERFAGIDIFHLEDEEFIKLMNDIDYEREHM